MVGVLGTFALSRQVGLQQMGLGLGVAILIDAAPAFSLDQVWTVHGSASSAPTVADGGARAPAARDYELQVFRVLNRGDEPVVVVRVDFYWKSQSALSSPVPSSLEVTHLSTRQFA